MSTAPNQNWPLRETLLFDWSKWDPGVAWRSTPALAIALALGIALGSPGAGLVAAAGAYTAGLGSLHKIRGSSLVPMLLASAGMTVAAFLGMILGHQSILFVVLAAVWAALYALLTVVRGGTSWVAMQWAAWFLVSGAFRTSPRAALMRCSLILAGGVFQTLLTMIVLRWPWRRRIADADEEAGPGLLESLGNARSCLSLRTPVCLYGLRMALVVTVATEFFRHTGELSGYWVPMTTLLVVRPDLYQTLTRGVMRVAGTIAGAGLGGLIAAYLHPSPAVLAALVVLFAWWAYSLLNVNYALFTLNVTAYIVFLLSLAGLPAATVVHRRAAYTALGGAFALLAYLDVFRKTRRWIRSEWEREVRDKAA
jgi:hypothetical protein